MIVAVARPPVDNETTLQFLIARTEVGSTAECVIIRDGQESDQNVRVAEATPSRSVRVGR